jgi:hypothetical protein
MKLSTLKLEQNVCINETCHEKLTAEFYRTLFLKCNFNEQKSSKTLFIIIATVCSLTGFIIVVGLLFYCKNSCKKT